MAGPVQAEALMLYVRLDNQWAQQHTGSIRHFIIWSVRVGVSEVRCAALLVVICVLCRKYPKARGFGRGDVVFVKIEGASVEGMDSGDDGDDDDDDS